MGVIDQNTKLDVKCPGCGRNFKQTVRRAQRDFDCPSCGFSFKGAGFTRKIKDSAKSILEFWR